MPESWLVNRSAQGQARKHLPALDGLRGVAILLVLAYHLFASNPDPAGSKFVRFFARVHAQGWIGVDLFFVLSGFLITGILFDSLSDRSFFRTFYARRALRIFPLYYGFLLCLFLITCFTHDHWFKGMWEVVTYSENLLWHGWWQTDASWININHLWSLAIEEQFYLVWPLLVYGLRTRRRILTVALFGIVASVCVRWYVAAFIPAAAHPYVIYCWTPARLDGLLAGAALAMLVRSEMDTRRFGVLLLLLGSCGLGIILLLKGTLEWQGHPVVAVLDPLLLAVFFSGLLLCALHNGSVWQRAACVSPLRFFGKYSYGLYLFHYTIVSALSPLRPVIAVRLHSKLLGVLLPGTAALVLSIGAAWLSFRYFESPFLRLKRRFERAPGPVSEPDAAPLPRELDLPRRSASEWAVP